MVYDAGLADEIYADSAGIADWRIGELPDQRAIQAAMFRGYDLSGLFARQINQRDFEKFDHILALDLHNFSATNEICPQQHRFKLQLLMEYAPAGYPKDVPDPYYGGADDFDEALTLIERATAGLLAEIKQKNALLP